ncbi:MAG: DGQHR domain-containing protein [Proteobacteria bacterium]|nr:DGQHR domain-containing protein [Pseudomonadota bacterium]
MRIFPGIRAKMGSWTYYVIKMKMRDLNVVKFAHELTQGDALGDTLQRNLKESRAKGAIVSYLNSHEHRFFNSIVIAAIGGDPSWFEVNMNSDPRLDLIAGDPLLSGAFGILRFSGTEDYYALDGQHRLMAIKELTDPSSDSYITRADGFENEEMSVVLVVPPDTTEVVARERFRRLFGHLNRYAKPMDNATTYIMEEDDVIAICTRRLFSAHKFFKTVGKQKESTVVYTDAGKNIKPGMTHFTLLEVLYSVNATLLSSRERQSSGWGSDEKTLEDYIKLRPSDEAIDLFYKELANYWTALLKAIPDLNTEPSKMRNHDVVDSDDRGDQRDHLLFYPIGQQLLAEVARKLIDDSPTVDVTNVASLTAVLKPLGNVQWDLDKAPWRHLLLTREEKRTGTVWKMRDTDRKPAVNVAQNLVLTFLRSQRPREDLLAEIKAAWKSMLLLQGTTETDDPEDMWRETLRSFKDVHNN